MILHQVILIIHNQFHKIKKMKNNSQSININKLTQYFQQPIKPSKKESKVSTLIKKVKMETKQKYKQTQKKLNKNQKRAKQHSQTQPTNQSTYSLRFKSQETTNRNKIASNNSSSN